MRLEINHEEENKNYLLNFHAQVVRTPCVSIPLGNPRGEQFEPHLIF